MLITCPACASEYTIETKRIGSAGRKVRCAACRESWFIMPPPPEEPAAEDRSAFQAVEVDAPQPEPAALPAAAPVVIDAEPASRGRRPKAATPRRRGRPADGAGTRRPGRALAALAIAGCCAALAAIPLRAAIVAALPGTASLYAAVGLPVNLVGLSLDNIASALVQENGTPVLVVTGRVRNVAGAGRPVLPLQLAIESDTGQPLYSWSARVAEAELAPGAETGFRVRLASPPPAGRRVQVTFRDTSGRLGVALH